MKFRDTVRRGIFAGLVFLAVLLISGPVSIRASSAVKNVLILFSGRFYAPLSVEVEAAVRAAFQKAPGVEVELFAETMDMARFDPERHGPILAAYLREKFADRKLDLIISSLPEAARFLLKFRGELFPDTPVVYCLADEAELAGLPRGPNVVGVPLRMPWKETLDLALQVHPDTSQIVVIAGTDTMARHFLHQTQEAFRPYESRLEFTYLTDRTLAQLLEEVAKLPPHTVIIYTDMVKDGAGRIYIGAEICGQISKAANAPVYTVGNTVFGRGIVGGCIVDYGAHAARAAAIGLRILAGEKPEAIPVEDVPSSPRFDARQLKRWKIAESRLPAGSVVMYKEPSFWQRYRLVLIALAVSLLEGLLILRLVLAGSRRRRAERKLAESEALSTGILASLPGHMAIVDRSGAILRTSEAWPKFAAGEGAGDPSVLGVGAKQSSFEPAAADPQGPIAQEIRRGIEAVLADGSAGFYLEYACPAPEDGWASVSVLPLRIAEGGAVIYRQDITQRQLARLEVDRLRGELAHVNRVMTVGGMTTAIAHELNQPLGAIMNNAQAGLHLLAAGEPRLDEVREILQDVIGDTRRAGDVILRLRTLLRKEKQEMNPIEINAIIRGLAAVARTDALLRKVEIELDLVAGLPAVQGDQVQLQQVMLNLIRNSIDAMGARGQGGRIRVRTTWDQDAVLVSVTDEGPGIPADIRPHIFEAFYTTKPAGMGLGLAICRAIVEAHGGRIWAANNPEGGATLQFTLPVGRPPARTA
jgi:signal transduction histidine kinase/ABC-type uncharacterized transport system substrate-binding protein